MCPFIKVKGIDLLTQILCICPLIILFNAFVKIFISVALPCEDDHFLVSSDYRKVFIFPGIDSRTDIYRFETYRVFDGCQTELAVGYIFIHPFFTFHPLAWKCLVFFKMKERIAIISGIQLALCKAEIGDWLKFRVDLQHFPVIAQGIAVITQFAVNIPQLLISSGKVIIQKHGLLQLDDGFIV